MVQNWQFIYTWILYEYNRWLVSATAEECVVSEKHLTQFFGKFGHLTRPDPTQPAGQPNPCPALKETHLTHGIIKLRLFASA